MVTQPHPTSVGQISTWARAQQVSVAVARTRFAQYVVLQGVANAPASLPLIAFKGGNALDLLLMPNRSTIDLDFSVIDAISPHESHDERIRTALDEALQDPAQVHDMALRVQSVTRNPARLDATFPTYSMRIAYALADQPGVGAQIRNAQAVSQVVHMEVTVNDVVCAWQTLTLPSGDALRVCTLDDIVAEKLRALLQQTIRNRHRPQDVLDIAMCVLTRSEQLSDANVADFLLRKAAARDVPVSLAAFEEPEVWTRARRGYEVLEHHADRFIPYEEARDVVRAFVRELDLPAT